MENAFFIEAGSTIEKKDELERSSWKWLWKEICGGGESLGVFKNEFCQLQPRLDGWLLSSPHYGLELDDYQQP